MNLRKRSRHQHSFGSRNPTKRWSAHGKPHSRAASRAHLPRPAGHQRMRRHRLEHPRPTANRFFVVPGII